MNFERKYDEMVFSFQISICINIRLKDRLIRKKVNYNILTFEIYNATIRNLCPFKNIHNAFSHIQKDYKAKFVLKC